jgi:hypothetical protein
MLFDPSSTFQSVVDNLNFLEKMCGDGSSAVTFCKMLPYAETRVEKELRSENRLIGELGFEDYYFLDPMLNMYYSCVIDSFYDWIMDHAGLLNSIRWTKYRLAVYRRYFPINDESAQLQKRATQLIADCNRFMLEKMKWMASQFPSPHSDIHNLDVQAGLKDEIESFHKDRKSQLNQIFDRIESLAQETQTASSRP